MVEAIRISRGGAIPLEEVEIAASRSSGPGGQHANVTASRIQATVDLQRCSGISDRERGLLMERFGPRASAVAQDTRSQARNRQLAIERLTDRLAEALVTQPPRRATRPSRAVTERRLEAKRRNAARKRDRGAPDRE